MKIRSDDDVRSQTDIRTDRCDLQRGCPFFLILKAGEKMIESTAETGKSNLLKNYYLLLTCICLMAGVRLVKRDVRPSHDVT